MLFQYFLFNMFNISANIIHSVQYISTNTAISLKFCGTACLIRNGVIILALPHIITTFASAVHTSSQQLHKLARARVAVICVPCRG